MTEERKKKREKKRDARVRKILNIEKSANMIRSKTRKITM